MNPFTGEFYQTFSEVIIPTSYKMKGEKYFYEASITLIPKSDKGINRKEH